MDSSKKEPAPRKKGFEGLGFDISWRIFARLPPVSLAYCTAVCSSWRNIITSSPNPWRSGYFLVDTRLKAREVETATTLENENADFRTRYIEEEQRTRLELGNASLYPWRAHSGRVNCCRMTMGQIISGSSDGTVRVWRSKSMSEIVPEGRSCIEYYKVRGKAPVIEVEFDENKVMGAAGKDVFVWSRTGNRRLLRRMGGHSEICSFRVADSDLAMGCNDGTVRVFDLYSSRCTQIFRLHTEPVKAVVMDMASQSMASGSNDGTVQLFDARSGQKIVSLLRPSSMTGISCLHLSPQDQRLFAGSMAGYLYCFDLRNQRTFWNCQVPGGALTCMDSPTYSRSAIGVGGVWGIKVFDVDSSKAIATFQVNPSPSPSSPVLSMALGMTKLVSCHANGYMIQWQLGEQRLHPRAERGPLPKPLPEASLQFPHERRVVRPIKWQC